ncbi:hypothetical protein AX14_011421 [Amanita brunnescens Koide BX004]|nr:hypothetical protein AX14_011421 [Amanita brunnescens Koide BX004]
MSASILAGELSALSDLPMVLVERPAVLWKLSSENLGGLRELATAFTLLIATYCSERSLRGSD